jgi:hypothetical protein
MSWDFMRKDLKSEFVAVVKELEELPKEKFEEIAEACRLHYIEQMKKEANKREFYTDYLNGIVTLIQFPKKSALANENVAKEPFVNKKGKWQWYGCKLPLMKTDQSPIIKIVIALGKGKTEEEKMASAKAKIESLWEPENEEIGYIMRGTIPRSFRWMGEVKGTHYRKEWEFLKEAKERYKEQEIKKISDIPKGTLDKIQYTFFVEQVLKVIRFE